MKKLQSSLTNMLLVLTAVALVAGGVLAGVNEVTAPRIKKINADNLSKGIRTVMGSGNVQVASPEVKDGYEFYAVSDTDGQSVGTAVTTATQGFGGPLKVLVGFDSKGTILGYTILESAETPGLGAKANTWFQKGQKGDVIGKNPGECNLTVSKDGGCVDAITASTITSRAFLNAVQQAYNELYARYDSQTSATNVQSEKNDMKVGQDE